MLSFRKIVNVLVLVSYVKMLLVTSFAMEADFQRATNALKLTMEPTFGANGQIHSMRLRLIQQDRSSGAKAERLVSEAHVDVAQGATSDNIKVIQKKGTCWFEWAIPNLGTVRVDLNGTMMLQGVTHQSPTSILKIKTSHLIILRNCAIHNLHLSSHAASLQGNNRLINFKANHSFGITAFNKGEERLKNLLLKQGRFVNATNLSLQSDGIWDLRGNSFLNQGTLILQGQGHTIHNASVVSNVGNMKGSQLTVSTKNYLNSGKISLAKLKVEATQTLMNQGRIHTQEEASYIFGEQLINRGQLLSDISFMVFSTSHQGILINGGLMAARHGEFKNLSLVNQAEIEHQTSFLDGVVLDNSHTLNLGKITKKSTASALKNSGLLRGTGGLAISSGENSGELDLTDLALTIDGRFINTGLFRARRLQGTGTFTNQGEVQTSRTDGITEIDIRRFESLTREGEGARMTGHQLQLGGNLEELVMDDQSQLLVEQLYISPAAQQNLPLTFQGVTRCGSIRLNGRAVNHTGVLRADEFHQREGDFRFSGVQAFLGTVTLDGQATFTNTTTVSLRNLILGESSRLHNDGELSVLGQDTAESIRVGSISGSGSFINRGKLAGPDKGRLIVNTTGSFENNGTAERPAEITGQDLVIGSEVGNFRNGSDGKILMQGLTLEPSQATHHQPIDNRGEIQAEVANLGRSLHNSSSCEFNRAKLSDEAKLSNQRGGDLSIGSLSMPLGFMKNHGVARIGALEVDSLEPSSWMMNFGRLELAHTSGSPAQHIDGRVLKHVLKNRGDFIAKGTLDYDYARQYLTQLLSSALHLSSEILADLSFLSGRVTAEAMLIRNLPLSDGLLKRLASNHHIQTSTDWHTIIAATSHEEGSQPQVLQASHDLSPLGRLSFQGDADQSALTFKDTVQTKGISFTNFKEVAIEKSVRATQGDVKVRNTGTVTVGVDNDHMGEIKADQGKVDVIAQDLINAKYGSVHAHKRVRLEALEGPVQLGERIVVPANQVASRIKADSEELKGLTKIGNNCRYCDYYISNGSFIRSDTDKMSLKSRKAIDLTFATVYAKQGALYEAPTVNFLNVNGFIFKKLTINGQEFNNKRTENHDFGTYYDSNITSQACLCSILGYCYQAKTLTSDLTQLFVLGDVELTTPHIEFLGVDFLVSGKLLSPDNILTLQELEKNLNIQSFEHYRRHVWYGQGWGYSAACAYFNSRFNFPPHVLGTTGGNVLFGQEFALTNDGLLIRGGGLGAQIIDLTTNNLALEALRQHLPRVALPIVGLDKVAERLARTVPTIRRTSQGGLTFKPQLGDGQADQTEVKTAPYWDEEAKRLTTTYPANVPFYLDNELEQITFGEQMRINLGRLHDDNGQSGEEMVAASVKRARDLAQGNTEITESSLTANPTCLLFYRLQKINGQDFLVPTAHIPQTTQADQVQRSGGIRATKMDITANTHTSVGGTLEVAGQDASMRLDIGRQETRAAQIPGAGTVRASEIAEHGDIHKTLHQDSILAELDTVAQEGTSTLQADADVTLTRSTMQAEQATNLSIKGVLSANSSRVTSETGPTTVKAGALNAQTLIETINTSSGYYQRPDYQKTTFGSKSNDLLMLIEEAAVAYGVDFYGTAVTMETGGSRLFGAIPMLAHSVTHWKKHTFIDESCTNLKTTFTGTGKPEGAEPALTSATLGTPLICPGRTEDSTTTFYELPISGDHNDCAFTCLGISRQEAMDRLLACKNESEARKVVAPEISRAFYLGDLERLPGFREMPAYQSLKALQHYRQWLNKTMETELYHQLGLKKDQTWKEAYDWIQTHHLDEVYPEFMSKATHYLNFEDELQVFTEDPDVYEQYLHSYIGTVKMMEYLPDLPDSILGNWKIQTSAFDLLARLLGKKLRIVAKEQDGSFKLWHEDNFEGEPLTLLHTIAGTQGGVTLPAEVQAAALNHYNLLLPTEDATEFLSFMQPKAKDGEIHVYSGGDAVEEGLVTKAKHAISLRAGGSYTQKAVHDWHHHQDIKKKRSFNLKSGFLKTRQKVSKHYHQTPQVCSLTSTQANKRLRQAHVEARKDLSLMATEIRADKIILESKEGFIKLLTALGVDCIETKKKSKDAVWQSQSQTFDYNENRQHCQFYYDEDSEDGGIHFKTPEGIVLEVVREKNSRIDGDKDKGRPREWQRLKDYSNIPGHEWMKLLDQREDVVRIYVDERHDSGRIAHQGMTAAAKIILTIIITAMTGGGGLVGLSAGGATAGTATATLGNVMTAFGNAALQGGMAAASNHLMFSMIDNRMNLRNVGRDMASSQTLKGIGMTALSSGLTQGLGTALKINPTQMQGFVQQAQGQAIRCVAQAVTRIAFGEKPKDVMKSIGVDYAINVASGTLANKIGKLRIDGLDPVVHKILHGCVGGAMQGLATALKGGTPEDIRKAIGGGATGALIAECVAEYLGLSGIENGEITQSNLDRESAYLTKISSLIGQLAAEVSGLDSDAAVSAGENAVENNAAQFLLFACAGGGTAGGTAATASGVAAVAEGLAVFGATLLGLIGLDHLINSETDKTAMDSADDTQGWQDEGVQTEQGWPQVNSTPIHEGNRSLPGFAPAPHDINLTLEGLKAYDGPQASVLTNDKQKEFSLSKEQISKTYKHDRFGKFYQNKNDELYYTKDQAKHGGSTWKVYRETGRGLEWVRDLGKNGEELPKHKGDVGKFIPKKDLNGVNGK